MNILSKTIGHVKDDILLDKFTTRLTINPGDITKNRYFSNTGNTGCPKKNHLIQLCVRLCAVIFTIMAPNKNILI